MTFALKGAGPDGYPGGMAVDQDRQVIYYTEVTASSIIAVDLVSGDRVIIGNWCRSSQAEAAVRQELAHLLRYRGRSQHAHVAHGQGQVRGVSR
jgi:hypothetical protein